MEKVTSDLESCIQSRKRKEAEAEEEARRLREMEANLVEARKKRDKLREKSVIFGY